MSWIVEAKLFLTFMNLIGIVVVAVSFLLSFAWLLLMHYINRIGSSLLSVLGATSFVGIEFLLTKIFLNFNYGALSYTLINVQPFTHIAGATNIFFITFLIIGANAIVGELLWKYRNRSLSTWTIISLTYAAVIFVPIALFSSPQSPENQPDDTVRVAIIQDQSRDIETSFGTVENNVFNFPALEQWVAEAAAEKPDMIIYPFNPWSGVMGERSRNMFFDREVIVIEETEFADWILRVVPRDSIFVTWYTRYDGTAFFNEIVYWQNGTVIHTYQKQKLFPFFDYTPDWAQAVGMYSTPVDGSVGAPPTPFRFDAYEIGNVICSELVDENVVEKSAFGNSLVLAIGSEAMFRSQIPSEYNLLNAQYFAAKYNVPMIRATRFGPSAVFDADGNRIAYLAYNTSGILFADISLTRSP